MEEKINIIKSTKENVLELAYAKGLLKDDNTLKQYTKLQKYSNELLNSILKKDPYDTIEAIGNVRIAIAILSKQLGFDDDECFKISYEEIKENQFK